jgi:hypothetical protein
MDLRGNWKTSDSFMEFLVEHAERDVSDVSRIDIVGFRRELAGKLSTDTVNRLGNSI